MVVVLLPPPLIQIRWTTILCEETPGNGIFNVHSNELFSQGPTIRLDLFLSERPFNVTAAVAAAVAA